MLHVRSRSVLTAAAVAALCVAPSPLLAQRTTALWGESGEAWDPAGLLPDFSFAGYRRGEKIIPDRQPTVSVTDYGAKPDADATAAFRKAIAENPGACIGVPSGRFLLSDRLRIDAAGTVLQGAGPRATVLHFTRSLEEIDPQPSVNGGGEPTSNWSWTGGLIELGNSNEEKSSKQAITDSPARGDRAFVVERVGEFAAGDDVLIEVKDDPAGGLTDYLYRGTPGDADDAKGKTFVRQVARVVAVDGDRLTVDRPLRTDVRPVWTPTVRKFLPRSTECGLEELTIEFEPGPYRGHFKEDGYNGVMVRGAHNWVRNVTIHDGDSGIYVSGQFHTVTGVTLTADRPKHSSGNSGHHGLTATGQDCLITDFFVRTQFFHDLTVDRGSVGNVFSNGRGADLCLDLHRFAPYENLFTDLHLGKGTRPWASGGAGGKGLHTAAGATFWNLESQTKINAPKEGFGPRDLVFVGLNAHDGGVTEPVTLPGGWYYEPQPPGRFYPLDLHQAQLAHRLAQPSR
ncbi:glycosyl hydrolase family 28-related protein [Alienimonas californiensis]|uniref:Pectate lyase superfamily protein n=1 Tax=Alienimonas californiensis TaxID=2527989 RepID=A0A517P4P4_9PLAN|nr:glycosyl hydrolase family 28-related protein [Alienimonas californiensis]QDT14331.1 Pectate lyase superfamily protein [Alienimonas californiensis]